MKIPPGMVVRAWKEVNPVCGLWTAFCCGRGPWQVKALSLVQALSRDMFKAFDVEKAWCVWYV